MANQRRDFLHKRSISLSKRPAAIVVEGLKVRHMLTAPLPEGRGFLIQGELPMPFGEIKDEISQGNGREP